MATTKMATTKVAILATSAEHRKTLKATLKQFGVDVVLAEAPSPRFLAQLTKSHAAVLLIDVDEDNDYDQLIDEITEGTELPVLFNDNSATGNRDSWAKKLVQKLNALTDFKPEPTPVYQTPHPIASVMPKVVVPLLNQMITPVQRAGAVLDLNVWVLGASLGGPQAVRQFLNALDADLPVAFILAQHIGANHVTLLAEQLDRVTKFKVSSVRSGHRLQHQEVVLTPADKQISFTADGLLSLQPAPAGQIYSPSIDHVMQEVAKHFGARAGTIIFSGMGDDGAKGCEAIADAGGLVWAQDIASCVVSSMPDQARKTGKVSYSARPDQLAQHLYQHHTKKKTR